MIVVVCMCIIDSGMSDQRHNSSSSPVQQGSETSDGLLTLYCAALST